MSTKYTPGPWHVSPQGNEQRFICTLSECLAEVYGSESWGRHTQGEANAQLIASAPEMLGALKDADLRCTQARIASTIGKKAGQADFLRGELERIQAVLVAAIQKAEPKQS